MPAKSCLQKLKNSSFLADKEESFLSISSNGDWGKYLSVLANSRSGIASVNDLENYLMKASKLCLIRLSVSRPRNLLL